MSSESTTVTVGQKRALEDGTLLKKVCEELKEDNDELVKIVLDEVGESEGQKLLDETLRIEKTDEGIVTADKSRRKSPGGVFFHLARDKIGKTKFNKLSQIAHRRRKQLRLAAEKAENDSSATKEDEGKDKDKAETKTAEPEAKKSEDEDKTTAKENGKEEGEKGKEEEKKKAE